ncbi:homeobox-leucine zipper protein HDG11-like [Vigna radiata var. radiata]|uniref:Homeobox-leucine zipper protein HDG11-like n=1 Tax=Vigna radiata var. radiata TaxID=3916 RepID=A0A1S3VG82_VIGRR|nr:homeobox-leucine zipper protein HDG11-like [Vigna radiata var. radiata]
MDFAMGAAGGSGDDDKHKHSHNKSSNKGKKAYHGHNSDRTSKLEEMFRKCPHPTKSIRLQMAEELGLEPKQVKFWFQNKRTQIKTQTERINNNIFRIENERIRKDNLLLREAFKNITCATCGGPSNDENRKHSLEQLRLENARLREELERLPNALAKYMDKSVLDLNMMNYTLMRGSSSRAPLIPGSYLRLNGSCEDTMLNRGRRITQMEKTMMSQIAVTAKEELIKLLCTNEPIWVKSSDHQRFVLHLESYQTFFPRINHFKNSQARVESSKDSLVVRIQAMKLVDMFLNSEHWTDLFSTIVTKARTIKVIENGSNRSGVLLLMSEEMHVLSPLVPSRELFFLRYCEQIEAHSWVIVDVSVDCTTGNNNPTYWKFPSGCIIHEISNELCWISWVEHVEVDEKIETHQLYKDIVNNSIAYGAERWLLELQRMCARFTSFGDEIPDYDINGVITAMGGRKNMIKFSHGMLKNFYGILNISSKTECLEHLAEENTDIMVLAGKYTNPSQSNAMIIFIATASFRLPLPSEYVFDFFRDPTKRAKWDVMCCESPVHEVARVSVGTNPSNCISIIQPLHRTANNTAIIQESYIDALGSYVVYSPVNISDVKMAVNGEDPARMSIFPSGIVISKDVQSITHASAWSSGSGDKRTHGTLMTMAFQILMNGPTTMVAESKTVIKSLMTSTIQNINHALINGSNLEF